MDDQLIQRIRRMYAAIGETVETEMSQLPAFVISTDKINAVFQDFRGNKTPEQLENALHSLIAIIASLEYHLRRWAHNNGHEPDKVTVTFRDSQPLQIIHDLWNNEKHGYPLPNGRDRSGVAPRLRDVRRVMRLTTQPCKGSVVGMTMGRGGVPVIHGDGNAAAVITGEVVDAEENMIGNADVLLSQAVDECESLMQQFDIDLAQP